MAYINGYVNRKMRGNSERNGAEKREGLKTLPYCGKGNGERAETQIPWAG